MYFDKVVNATLEGQIDQGYIKQVWNSMLTQYGWDNLSFYNALSNEARWGFDDIQLFGQVGFGTGGWNTDYPNSFLEVLRVMYTSLDVDQRLMYDGVDAMPKRLWSSPPESLGDTIAYWPPGTTVESLTRRALAERNLPGPLGLELNSIQRNPNGAFTITTRTTDGSRQIIPDIPAIIYTPHVRILDKFRSTSTNIEYQWTTGLFDSQTWEAIMYTHYMQSTKIFLATKNAFWRQRDAGTGKEKMSVTLSDRLPRGTYLVDYSGSRGADRGAGIFLSYTWNDDSLKFLGGRADIIEETEERGNLCKRVLETIYPNVDFGGEAALTNANVSISWEAQRLFLGGFKNNLPGHYRYQKRLFSQFMDGVDASGRGGDRFVLAGDDISWVAGWCEGAIHTAINAVNKMAVAFGGGALAGNPGPINEWNQLRPIDLP
jgi:tryptophan 2-monooxygenase